MQLCRTHWSQSDYEEFLTELKISADPKYKEFMQRLIPGEQNILGVRMPVLRNISKEIAKGNFAQFLGSLPRRIS
ncbi:MAG TPA: hypothetical protein GXX17_02115 [Clostridiales bacterium]|nr:hypothetical protein [Clostridiales bacterium]